MPYHVPSSNFSISIHCIQMLLPKREPDDESKETGAMDSRGMDVETQEADDSIINEIMECLAEETKLLPSWATDARRTPFRSLISDPSDIQQKLRHIGEFLLYSARPESIQYLCNLLSFEHFNHMYLSLHSRTFCSFTLSSSSFGGGEDNSCLW